jgi:dienelactone hydrolase
VTRAVSLLALAALLAGCGSSKSPSPPRRAADTRLDFAYDASAPLRYVDRGRVNTPAPLAIHDVSFTSGGKRIDGYLVLPPGPGRRPAVVFVPGTGGDRSELLAKAGWLAARNVVTLTITPPLPSTANRPVRAVIAGIRTDTVAQVVAVRRAVDVLRSLPSVDPRRIGYVGWSAGARLGTLVAASDPRIRSFVLLSAGATPISAYVKEVPRPVRAQIRQVLESIDPLRYVRLARPRNLFLADGKQDGVVPRAALLNMVHAAPKGTTVRWYDAPHELNRAAYHDAYDWLERRLPIDGPRVRGAETA